MASELGALELANDVAPLDLGESSLEDVVYALCKGHPIKRSTEEVSFSLDTNEARGLFAFYRDHRELWPRSKAVYDQEIDKILRAISKPLTPESTRLGIKRIPANRWKLTRVQAHRFAGLHRHCGPNAETPELFTLELEHDVTLVSGFNGAGKTALQSAITWCLTNRALRSQHMPDEVHEPMDVSWSEVGDEDGNLKEARNFKIPPIVPIPSGEELNALNDRPIVDTWVCLTFQSEMTLQTCEVRRSLTATSKGVKVVSTGIDALGLSPLAIEAGTLIPGIAASMRFDEKTTFAKAVALLTGLQPLDDLGQRSVRILKRLQTDETRKTASARDEKLKQFRNKRQTIADTWKQTADVGTFPEIHDPGITVNASTCESSIAIAQQQLTTLRESLEGAMSAILGKPLRIDGSDELGRARIKLTNAADALKGSALGALPSIKTTTALSAISGEDCRRSIKIIEALTTRAVELSSRLKKKEEAARWQLYVRVAAWHKENHPTSELSNCPVCETHLNDVPPDALLSMSVKEALTKSQEAHSDTGKNARAWEVDAARELLNDLPESIRIFADVRLPDTLLGAYRHAYVDELFGLQAFGDTLKPLKLNAANLWEIAAKENPLVEISRNDNFELPAEFRAGNLAKRIENALHCIRLAEQKRLNAERIGKLLDRYIGKARDAGCKDEAHHTLGPEILPLREQIETVRKGIESVTPVASLLRQLSELDAERRAWEEQTARLVLIEKAILVFKQFTEFPSLVHEQVSGLIAALVDNTRKWLDRIYRPHYNSGPSFQGLDPAQEHGVGIRAGTAEMNVPAHSIMNASQLRACVWAFMFSLWEHVRAKVGGLDCFLLDDPQTHFDWMNAENLAAAIPMMPQYGMHPLVTSNDNHFLDAIRAKLPASLNESPTWIALMLNPVSSSRLSAELSPLVEEIYERRKQFLADENSVTKAQCFVDRVRLFIENRLWDLLAGDPHVMHKPTLGDLLNALRRCKNVGERPFDERPFAYLLDHRLLSDRANFNAIINKAHHRLRDITPFDAKEVSDGFNHVEGILRSCTAAYARFMGRLTRQDADLVVDETDTLVPIRLRSSPIPILGEVSARSSANLLALAEETQSINLDGLGDVTLIGVRGSSLGTVALAGQVVVASLNAQPRDGDPVVAIVGEKIHIRRYWNDRQDSSRILLISDFSGSENVPPALAFPRSRARVLPIVGILYADSKFQGSSDGCLIDGCSILQETLTAVHISDHSAYPVIREGDTVLLEDRIDKSRIDFSMIEGELVVIVVAHHGDTFAYLKRVGREIRPGERIFENIGTNGEALAAADPRTETAALSALPTIEQVWRVRGVIRRSS